MAKSVWMGPEKGSRIATVLGFRQPSNEFLLALRNGLRIKRVGPLRLWH